jgi:hypothetical protein
MHEQRRAFLDVTASLTGRRWIGPGIEAEDRVGVRIMPRQHQHRAFHARLAQPLAQLAPVGVRQADVKDHEVIGRGLGLLHALGTGPGLEDVEILGQDELLRQGFPQVVVIIDEKYLAQGGHGRPPLWSWREDVATSRSHQDM